MLLQLRRLKLNSRIFPVLLILAGILFSLYLQLRIPEDVFFSGDAGLKALLAKQLSSGQLRFDLLPPEQSWIQSLWAQGFYPYKEPFVYHIDNRYYITFPYTFPLITAPFYHLFGYRGLYVIPLVSIWVIWLSFYWVGQKLGLDTLSLFLGLVILIFASHLTLYSAMYWEHTLAVALAFQGFAILLTVTRKNLSKTANITSGILIGLACWFRPEFFALAFLLVFLACLAELSNLNFRLLYKAKKYHLNLFLENRSRTVFVLSLVLTALIFFISNQVIYGHPLGIHAIQVVDKQSFFERLITAGENFRKFTLGRYSIFQFLPVLVVLIIQMLLAYFLVERSKRDSNIILIFVISIAFILGVSILVPAGGGGKQWGPRFLLFLAPLLSLSAAKLLQYNSSLLVKLLRRANLLLVGTVLILGIHQNCFLGVNYLNSNYQAISSTVKTLKKSNEDIVVVSHQFLAQVFAPAVSSKKIFFRAEHTDALLKLSEALLLHKNNKFYYICYSANCKGLSNFAQTLRLTHQSQDFSMHFAHVNQSGIYSTYQVELLPTAKSQALAPLLSLVEPSVP